MLFVACRSSAEFYELSKLTVSSMWQ